MKKIPIQSFSAACLLFLKISTIAGFETKSIQENLIMFGAVTNDVCDLNLIYNKLGGYEYSLPRPVLESYLSGKAFDNPEVYSEEESNKLKDDIRGIYESIVSKNPDKDNWAVLTAGAPGVGKTTKLWQDLEENNVRGKTYAYVCPDDVCLKNQVRTYQKEIESGDQSILAKQNAYNKWRPASNAASHLILGNLIREKYAFYFGTTASGPATGKFFEFIKKQGYKIRVIHVTASDNVRWESIQERDKSFVQTTEQDVKEKGLLLPQRINDTFLAFADEIEFYYRDGVKQNALLAAQWTRNGPNSPTLGTLQVISPLNYEKIKAIHNSATDTLNRQDLKWESTVEKNSKFKSY